MDRGALVKNLDVKKSLASQQDNDISACYVRIFLVTAKKAASFAARLLPPTATVRRRPDTRPEVFNMMIISGGQTGADQAALDAAIILGIPHGGWLPKGRKTEKGPLPLRYELRELDSTRYRDRTEHNILAADGTLIFSFGPLTGGSALTEALAIRHNRPFLHIDFELVERGQAASLVEQWIRDKRPGVVNIAGPRASNEPRIYEAVYALLTGIRWPLRSQS